MARLPQEFLEKLSKAFAKITAEHIIEQVMKDLLDGVPAYKHEEYCRYATELIAKGKVRQFKDFFIDEDEMKL